MMQETNFLKRGALLLLLAFGFKAQAQQGVQFTQYAFTGLTVNPAYAGYKENLNLNLVSRLQWTGIDGAPRTGAVSVDGVIDPYKNMGLGLVLTGDQLGPQTNASAYINYAYRLRLNDEDTQRLCFGIGAGANVYSVDNNKLYGSDLNDPGLIGSVSKFSPDFRLGVYYYSSRFYAGASVLNLTAETGFTDARVLRQTRSYYFTAGYMLPLSDYVDWKPSILVKEDFKGPTNIDISTNFLLGKVLWLGATYRTGSFNFGKNLQDNLSKMDAIAAIAEFYINPDFRLGYSYDYSMNKLATAQNGTHEVSLGFSFGRRRERVVNPRYF